LLFAAIFLLIFFIFSVFNKRIKPTILSIAEAKAKYIATQAINESVNEKIVEKNLNYSELVNLQKNINGEITALQANIIKMNEMKAELTISIQNKIAEIDSTEVYVPIGNIINNDILSGWGPRIPARLIPVGTAQVDFKNNFTTAGINQTKHEIYLEVQAKVAVLLPAARKNTEVVTSVPIAETIIVGTVPDTYTNVEGTTGSVPDNILNMIP